MSGVCGLRRLAKLAFVTGAFGMLRGVLEEPVDDTYNYRPTDPSASPAAFLEVEVEAGVHGEGKRTDEPKVGLFGAHEKADKAAKATNDAVATLSSVLGAIVAFPSAVAKAKAVLKKAKDDIETELKEMQRLTDTESGFGSGLGSGLTMVRKKVGGALGFEREEKLTELKVVLSGFDFGVAAGEEAAGEEAAGEEKLKKLKLKNLEDHVRDNVKLFNDAARVVGPVQKRVQELEELLDRMPQGFFGDAQAKLKGMFGA